MLAAPLWLRNRLIADGLMLCLSTHLLGIEWRQWQRLDRRLCLARSTTQHIGVPRLRLPQHLGRSEVTS